MAEFENRTGIWPIDAAWFDGKSARRHPVQIHWSEDGIRITGNELAQIHWNFRDLELVSKSGGRFVLTNHTESEPRLAISQPGALADLTAFAPQLESGPKGLGSRRAVKVSAVLVASMAALMGFLYVAPVFIVPFIPDSFAKNLGVDMVNMVSSLGGFCQSEQGSAALDQLTLELAGGELAGGLTVQVIDHQMVNAFAASGGQIVLMRGLIDAAESGDEIAGVLAHEIGHVEHRHPLTNLVRALGFEIFLTSLGGDLGDTSNFILSMSFSREAEREADISAIRMLNEANISPTGLARFFDRLSGEDEDESADGFFGGLASLASSHPPTGERAALARTEGQNGAEYDNPLTDEDWKALQMICQATESDEAGPDGEVEDDASKHPSN